MFWGDDRLEQALALGERRGDPMSLLPELTTEEVERYARHIVLRDIGGSGPAQAQGGAWFASSAPAASARRCCFIWRRRASGN